MPQMTIPELYTYEDAMSEHTPREMTDLMDQYNLSEVAVGDKLDKNAGDYFAVTGPCGVRTSTYDRCASHALATG